LFRLRITAAPPQASPQQRKNFINVQIDAVGVGLANAAIPFLPVLLTRLGADNYQVGLLNSMPAITGFLTAFFIGRFLQTRQNIVIWFSGARFLAILAYAATSLVLFFVTPEQRVSSILLVWALATIPQTVVNVGFSVVMNAVAGPGMRYDLMSRRWSILGLTTAIMVALAGQVLVLLTFPQNYQVVFIVLSIGGFVSLYFSSHIQLPPGESPASVEAEVGHRPRAADYLRLILGERDFIRFSIQRFVYLSGISLALPLIPLYLVREVDANDAWIGFINTAQTAVMLIGYIIWTRSSRTRGGRFVLLCTTLGLSLYPALMAMTRQAGLIVVYAGLAGIFQAGLDLVMFDELMKTIPVKYSPIFVSTAQSLQHLSSIAMPLLGTILAGWLGLPAALMISAGLRLAGFALFAFWREKPATLPAPAPPEAG
jgi:MFS family permease